MASCVSADVVDDPLPTALPNKAPPNAPDIPALDDSVNVLVQSILLSSICCFKAEFKPV
jgi:hypothetical protein